jgi:hypothetical protein
VFTNPVLGLPVNVVAKDIKRVPDPDSGPVTTISSEYDARAEIPVAFSDTMPSPEIRNDPADASAEAISLSSTEFGKHVWDSNTETGGPKLVTLSDGMHMPEIEATLIESARQPGITSVAIPATA